MDARYKSRVSSEVLDFEAERLYFHFRDYVKSRKGEQAQSLSEVLAEFYSELGFDGVDSRGVRSSLTRRFKKLIRKYSASDSENQKKLDEFIFIC